MGDEKVSIIDYKALDDAFSIGWVSEVRRILWHSAKRCNCPSPWRPCFSGCGICCFISQLVNWSSSSISGSGPCIQWGVELHPWSSAARQTCPEQDILVQGIMVILSLVVEKMSWGCQTSTLWWTLHWQHELPCRCVPLISMMFLEAGKPPNAAPKFGMAKLCCWDHCLFLEDGASNGGTTQACILEPDAQGPLHIR